MPVRRDPVSELGWLIDYAEEKPAPARGMITTTTALAAVRKSAPPDDDDGMIPDLAQLATSRSENPRALLTRGAVENGETATPLRKAWSPADHLIAQLEKNEIRKSRPPISHAHTRVHEAMATGAPNPVPEPNQGKPAPHQVTPALAPDGVRAVVRHGDTVHFHHAASGQVFHGRVIGMNRVAARVRTREGHDFDVPFSHVVPGIHREAAERVAKSRGQEDEPVRPVRIPLTDIVRGMRITGLDTDGQLVAGRVVAVDPSRPVGGHCVVRNLATQRLHIVTAPGVVRIHEETTE